MIANLKWAMNNVYQYHISHHITYLLSKWSFYISVHNKPPATPYFFPSCDSAPDSYFTDITEAIDGTRLSLYPKPRMQSKSNYSNPDLLHSCYRRETMPAPELGAQILGLRMLWPLPSCSGISSVILSLSYVVYLFNRILPFVF